MNRSLKDILKNITPIQVVGDVNLDISSLEFDSRKVESRALFFAINGTLTDGHKFIDKAIEKGAIAIACEKIPNNPSKDIVFIQFADTAAVLGHCVSVFYDNPSENINLIGITGTNGKTTTASLLYELHERLGYKTGLISTVKNIIHKRDVVATHTTPDVININKLLQEMVEDGCEYCFMEVSSHAIDQKRISGLRFVAGVFTNITQDHFDYHKTFQNYINTKKEFFDNLPKEAFALSNADDRNGKIMLQNTKAKKHYYGINTLADFHTKIVENAISGLHLITNGREIWSRLIGKFNAYNITSVFATSVLLGHSEEEVLTELTALGNVKGRFDYFVNDNNIMAIVDYAHTPDALQNVLSTINEIRTHNEKLITVVGAGGDRDKSKRAIMGKVATELSDKIIFCSDNPRTEDPELIIDDIVAGVEVDKKNKFLRITDRKEAIKTAVMLAEKGDIILVSGKGHETYQEIKGVKHDFDDKRILIEMLKN